MMYRQFNCPHCGAPGEVVYGQATYTCTCRLVRQPTYGSAAVSCCGGRSSTDGFGNRAEYLCERHAAERAAADKSSAQATPTPGWMTEAHIIASPETKVIDKDGARWLGCVYGDNDDWRIYAIPIRTVADQP